MITVVGGVYGETCIEPFWDDVFGSAGRAAAAISGFLPNVRLVTYRAKELVEGIDNLVAAYGLEISGTEVDSGVRFEYIHSLGTPRIVPRPDAIGSHAPLVVKDDVVLRFGMLEGTAKVTGRRVIYDPQSAFDPRPFRENGSSAETLALILNRLEGGKLTGKEDPAEMAEVILASGEADVVIVKMGGHGALVAAKGTPFVRIPAYRSENVWKIGSGDVFSGAFAYFWGVKEMDAQEAAELASRATSHYCGTRALPILPIAELQSSAFKAVAPTSGRIYIASPFFNLGERWVVEEVRNQLLHLGVEVFSPLHDVGVGPGEIVAKQDLEGLDRCDVVLAILNGGDAGTIFEIGYAVARGTPVVALAQNVRPEDLKMPIGSGCKVYGDLVTAIYQAIWALP